MTNSAIADSIAESILYSTGIALMSRDFSGFQTHFSLPLKIETINGFRFLNTEDDLSRVFWDVLAHMDETGVEDIVRTVLHAEFLSTKIIRSIHICSEIHLNGKLSRPPYPVHSTLVHDGDRWRISYCLYVILDSEKHNRALVK